MWRFGCGVVLCGALVGGLATPAFAEDGVSDGTGSALVGGFSVGDGLEAMIEEREGSLRFQLPIGGLTASWDSRRVGANRSGLGFGWDWSIGAVDTSGGVRVFPAAGGVYDADDSVTSGLRGYEVGDVAFEQREGVLPARDGIADARPYSFVLAELGGVTTYFSAAGDALASIDLAGDRKDWVWGADHRLTAAVDAHGVRTDLVWSDDASSLFVRRATNVGTEQPAEWRVQFGQFGVESVTDPLDQATTVAYTEAGLVASITGVSGSSTEVTWQSADDGIARVDEIATVDPERGVLSSRTWEASSALPTGWPATAQSGGSAFETVLSDGPSRVVSSYSALGLLTHRELQVSTASGSNVVQTTDFTYPDIGDANPLERPGNWSRPTTTEITYLNASGGSRSVTESSVFDDFGRVVERTAADGTVTTTEYDPTVSGELGVPIGLAVRETVRTPDGFARERVNTLNLEHTAVVGTEVRESRPDGEHAVVERVEFEVEDDGFVREQRTFAQGDTVPAVVTRWDEQVDLSPGTLTRSETVAFGTPVEATTSQVASLVHGAVVETVDELGNRTTARLDAVGRPVAVTDPAGLTTTTAYEVARGRSTVTTTTPDGIERTEVQDSLGRVIELTDNIATEDDGRAMPVAGHVRRVETREYTPAQVSVTDAWGATSTATHDVFGRLVAAEGSTGAVEVTEYDDIADTQRSGLTPTGDLADAQVVRKEQHDTRGSVIGTTRVRTDREAPEVASATFDGLGRMTFASDGMTESHIGYDAFGRESSRRMSAAGSTVQSETALQDDGEVTASLAFDAFGRSTAKTLSAADEQRVGYTRVLDELGRTVEETDQSGAWTRYGYTVDGLVAWSETSAGQRTEVEYDPLTRSRLSMRVSSPDTDDVATVYHYDRSTGLLAWVADAANPERTRIKYEHDAFGNVTKVTYPDDGEVRSQYDEHGRRTAVVDVAGNRSDYTYTEAGVLESVVQHDASGVELARAAYTYDDLGRVAALDRGNELVTEYTFTSADEISTERTTKGGALLDERMYTYDLSGNLTRRVDTTRDAVDAPAVSTSTEYVYDSLQRLVGSTVRNGAAADAPVARETEYELSLAGDIVREIVRTDPGRQTESTTTRSFGYSARSELTTITTETGEGTTVAEQTYDARGNLMAAADGGSYVFDAADRPIAHTAADGTVTATEYWADGSRKLQRSGGETTTFHWDGETLVNETVDSGEGAGVAGYLIGAARHARTVQPAGAVEGVKSADPVTSYFGTDLHGNVTDLTDPDGVVTARYAYTDYGTTTRTPVGDDDGERGIARNPFRYAGEHTDRTGTQHLATRSYDDLTMRFISMDDAPLENRFAFGDLNPIMKVDPSGRTALDLVSWTVAAIGTMAAVASVAGAIYAAAIAAHGLAVMSVAAIAANAGAAAAAAAVAVDANVKDFMDDDTANMVALGELLLPIGMTLAVAALSSLAEKAAAHLAKKAATKVKNPFPKTPLFTKKYSKEWATTRDGQKAWQDLQTMIEKERGLDQHGHFWNVWDDWYTGLRENSDLYRKLYTKTGPTAEHDQLLDWLIEAEWKATSNKSGRYGDSLEFANLTKKSLIKKGSPAVHANYHKQRGTVYLTRDGWNEQLNRKKLQPNLNVGTSYDLD